MASALDPVDVDAGHQGVGRRLVPEAGGPAAARRVRLGVQRLLPGPEDRIAASSSSSERTGVQLLGGFDAEPPRRPVGGPS